MALTLGTSRWQQFGELRIEPTAKRVRALLDGVPALDSRRALLVWEPKRVVPTYAVPRSDVLGTVTESEADAPVADPGAFPWPVWDPRVPFAVRTTPGHGVTISMDGGSSGVAAFVADDPDLSGYLIVDFDGFDAWREDDDLIVSHPHDPFSRIDIRSSSQHLEFGLSGVMIADTSRAKLLYETGLPIRYYIPREDVLVELLSSATVTTCAYKGSATYYRLVVAGTQSADLAWSYEDPLIDAHEVKDCIAFFDEKLDVVIDDVLRPRPVTPWS